MQAGQGCEDGQCDVAQARQPGRVVAAALARLEAAAQQKQQCRWQRVDLRRRGHGLYSGMQQLSGACKNLPLTSP